VNTSDLYIPTYMSVLLMNTKVCNVQESNPQALNMIIPAVIKYILLNLTIYLFFSKMQLYIKIIVKLSASENFCSPVKFKFYLDGVTSYQSS
jgi:hypothetical protein